MSKKVKIFAIVVLAIALIIGGFSFFGGSSSPDTLSSTTLPTMPGAMPGATSTAMPAASTGITTTALPGGPAPMAMPGANTAAANEFSGLLSSVNSITIDTSIFQNPAYKTLRDYPVSLGTDIVGRNNPFAPIGTDSSSNTPAVTLAVQTLAPGKITNSTAELGATVTLPDTLATNVLFEYGVSDTFGSVTNPLSVTKTGTVLSTISGLKPGTKYFVQAVVVRGSSTTTGNIMTFTTTGTAPVVTQ